MVKGFPKVDQLLSPSDWSLQIFICDTGISCTDWVLSLVPVINSEMDGKILMDKAEYEARLRGCSVSYIDTFTVISYV